MSHPSTLSVRVARKHAEALDICTFELVAADASNLPGFSAVPTRSMTSESE